MSPSPAMKPLRESLRHACVVLCALSSALAASAVVAADHPLPNRVSASVTKAPVLD